MAKVDTLFITQTADKTIPFGVARTYKAHIREYTLPGFGSETGIESLI